MFGFCINKIQYTFLIKIVSLFVFIKDETIFVAQYLVIHNKCICVLFFGSFAVNRENDAGYLYSLNYS